MMAIDAPSALLRIVLWMAVAILGLFCAQAARAGSYLNASTTYSWVDPSSHTIAAWTSASACSSGGSALDDDITGLLSIGFTFNFGGTDYTQVRIMTNGRLQFANAFCGFGTSSTSPRTYPYAFPDANLANTIRIYGADLDLRTSGTGTTCPPASCHVRYSVTGTSPSRRFIVTWVNVPEWSAAGSSFNLQIILEEDGDFIFQYGTSSNTSGGSASIGYQLDTSDYDSLSGGLRAAGTAIRFYMKPALADYRMDESVWSGAGAALDSSGNAYHGTPLGSAASSSTGKLCYGGNFPANTSTGTISAINTNLDVDSQISSRSGTITFWYRSAAQWRSSGAIDSQLFDATVNNDQWFFLVKRGNGVLRFVVTDTGGNDRVAETSAQTIAANTWVHIAVTWNMTTTAANNRLRVYINGSLADTEAISSTNAVHGGIGTLYVGDNRSTHTGENGTGNSASGLIDEFKIYDYEGGIGLVRRDMNATRTCGAGQFDIDIGAASASTCVAKSVTITAQDGGGATLTGYTGTINLSTSSGKGDWSLVTGSGTLSNGTSDDGAASYTFAAADGGVVTVGLTHQIAQVVTVTAVDASDASTLSTSSAISFSDNAFVFTEDLSARIAGTDVGVAGRLHDYQVSLYRRDPSTSAHCAVAASYGGSKALKAWITRDGSDPGGASPSISAVSLGNSLPGSNNLTLTFTSGVATFNLATTDVGKFAINFRDDTTTGLTAALSGSSNNLTVRPFAMVVSAIQRGATANPNTNAATGTVFTQAGESFQASVGAYRHATGADSNDDGVPDASATLAQTTAGGLAPSFAYATTLSAASPFTPASGTLGTLANGSISSGSFSGGSSTPATLNYSEVGSFTMALAVSSYLGTAGLNLTGTVFNAAGSQNAVVGRFTPYDFGVSLNTPVFTPGCSSVTAFTYIGQPFVYGTAPVITVTARNKAGATTRNYTGSWWKISNATLTGRSYAAATGTLDTSGLPATTVDPVIVDLGGASSGQGTLTFSAGSGLKFTRAAPVAPFNADIALSLNVLDSDSVAYASNPARFGTAVAGSGISFSGTGGGKPMRWGRLKLANAMGTEFANLLMPAEAQYYNGTGFVLNADDGCTSMAKSAVQFGNFQRNLAACETFLSTTVSALTLSGGKATLNLNPPGGGNTGSVDLTPGLSTAASGTSCVSASSSATPGVAAGVDLTWLRSNWDPLSPTAYDRNPTGRAVFGIPRVPREVIFSRENY